MTLDRKTAAAVVVALALGYCLAYQPSPSPRPDDRPVLRWIARAAKSLLWIALVAEQPPKDPQPDHRVAQNRIGDDGYPVVDHARGW